MRLLLPLAALLLSACATSPTPETVSLQHTYLKAKPGELDTLRGYITDNWYDLDRQGVERGIFTSYQLYESREPEADREWDYVMIVGYPQALGYGDPDTQAVFQAIRAATPDRPADGKTLRDLADILSSVVATPVVGDT